MRTIATLRNIEFGADPFTLIPTPPSVERLARDFGHALDAIRGAERALLQCPSSRDALEGVLIARDELVYAEGDLWDTMRKLTHRVCALQDGRFLWLSDTPAPGRPHLVLASAEGVRQCPGCYGVGVYRLPFTDPAEHAPCVVCHRTGTLMVDLPACCRKDIAHVAH